VPWLQHFTIEATALQHVVLLQLTLQRAQRGLQEWRLPGARPEEQLAARHLKKQRNINGGKSHGRSPLKVDFQ
jgi:hypothetical protein